MAAATPTAFTAARTLDALKRHFGLSDQAIANLCPGYTRDKVTDRRRGGTAIDANDMDAFGKAFGVPSSVFLLDAAEAIRFVLDMPDEGPDLPTDQSGWIPRLAAVA